MYKPGDVVRCVSGDISGVLEEGKLYIVKTTTTRMLWFEGVGGGWLMSRVILSTPEEQAAYENKFKCTSIFFDNLRQCLTSEK